MEKEYKMSAREEELMQLVKHKQEIIDSRNRQIVRLMQALRDATEQKTTPQQRDSFFIIHGV